MHAFERGRRHQSALPRYRKQRRAFDHEKRPEPLAAAEACMAHGLQQARRAGTLAGNRIGAEKLFEKPFRGRRDLAQARHELRAAVIDRHDKSHRLRFWPPDLRYIAEPFQDTIASPASGGVDGWLTTEWSLKL